MKIPRLLIVANGEAPTSAFLRRAARGAAAVICTDGGYLKAEAAGLRPKLVIGDLDSLPRGVALHAGVRVLLDDDPETSDLDKALRFACESRFAKRWGAGEVWIVGAFGGRIDQLLSNLQVAEKYAPILRLRLVDPAGTAEVVTGSVAFKARRGETVSIFPLGPARVRSSGLRYKLSGERLTPGSRGLSNSALGGRVTLRVLGRAWLVRAEPPWR